MAAFANRSTADQAVNELENAGFITKDLSVITKENTAAVNDLAANGPAEGAAAGAATGTAVGGIAGLLAGAGVIPAIAGLLIGGPIAALLGATGVAATTISGAVTGAVAGGLLGALTNLGIPEESARYYETTVNEGGIVIAIPVSQENEAKARSILAAHGADRLSEIQTS